jgi:hypothetical protein
MVMNKNWEVSIFAQKARLIKLFPMSTVKVEKNVLTWKYSISPSPLSETYDVKLVYKAGFHPCIYVINKKLELYPGETTLPHVYNTEKQWLCLYYRKANEWNNHFFIADMVVPWISEWLLHYEFWLATGEWHGKGIHGNIEPYKKNENHDPILL